MGDFTPNYTNNNNNNNNNNYSIIKSLPLDSIDFPQIDVIKIDVQGWENKVLDGAKNILSKYKPILIIEIESHQLIKVNSTPHQLIERIRDMGYYIYYLEYVYPSDYICVHTDNISAFQNKFSKYIFEHTENNIINNNILYGINKKITMKLFNDKKY